MGLTISPLLQGRRGRYRLAKLIGRGGMSEVWLADSSQGSVAVKISASNPTAMEKLIFERQILKELRHEHVVAYVDEGEQRGLPFLVMEYVPGASIEQLVRSPLDEKEARAVAVGVLLALDYIHARNVIHRDVKPKNVLARDNHIRKCVLIDFGTAAFYNVSGIKEAVISPGGYTAPEQYNFRSSPQADIWSVGALLFYLLTARHPQQAMPGYPQRPPPTPISVRMFNRDVSEEMETVVRKAMAWNPSERYLSAREMIEAIEGIAPEVAREDIPILEVMGTRIRIDADRLIFGRLTEESEEKVVVEREGDAIYVKVADPYKWISRMHFEIFRSGGKWYIRDLGSLNRTAVQTKGRTVEVWAAPRVESQAVELGDKAVIYIAYGSSPSNQPYVVASFRYGKP
ncbi:protein kinase domain-containing protein [Infirmifilum sp.]|uniref:protein kinase domain-containing protein n=1 Tax=Infirmifilum sp. TaxID=2856575 RepID=UPI003D12EE2C